MTEIESGDVSAMVDSSSSELLQELNSKREKAQTWPLLGVAGVVAAGGLSVAGQPAWWSVAAMGVGVLAAAVMYVRDQLAKTTVIFYDLASDALTAYGRVVDAFDALSAAGRVWHISAQGAVQDRKYHAGASSLVNRTAIRPQRAGLPYVKTNVDVPTLSVGRQLLAFMPDRLLVFDTTRVGAVAYSDLRFQIRTTRFIEEESVPGDAQVVDSTWKCVNKSGGPDRRFKDNRQLPIAQYDEVLIHSGSGLQEMLHVSKVGLAEAFAGAIEKLAREASTSNRTERKPGS